jgi:hypothetical protein
LKSWAPVESLMPSFETPSHTASNSLRRTV